MHVRHWGWGGLGWGGDDNILVRSTRDDMFGTTYMFGIGDGVVHSKSIAVGSTWKSFAQNKWKAEPDRHSMVDSGTEFISGSFVTTHASDKYTSCGKKGKKNFSSPTHQNARFAVSQILLEFMNPLLKTHGCRKPCYHVFRVQKPSQEVFGCLGLSTFGEELWVWKPYKPSKSRCLC